MRKSARELLQHPWINAKRKHLAQPGTARLGCCPGCCLASVLFKVVLRIPIPPSCRFCPAGLSRKSSPVPAPNKPPGAGGRNEVKISPLDLAGPHAGATATGDSCEGTAAPSSAAAAGGAAEEGRGQESKGRDEAKESKTHSLDM